MYQQGIRRKAKHMTLRALQHSTRDRGLAGALRSSPARVGVSISQKVSKRAVVRNRIKRQIHAGLRSFLPGIQPGWDLVFVIHPQAVECDYLEFLRELEQLLVDAEVFDEHS